MDCQSTTETPIRFEAALLPDGTVEVLTVTYELPDGHEHSVAFWKLPTHEQRRIEREAGRMFDQCRQEAAIGRQENRMPWSQAA